MNHRTPSPSNAAVFRLAFGADAGSGKALTASVAGSTRRIALRPPSVIQGAPSGPTITPCGAEPGPRGISRTAPVRGSSQPSSPLRWAVYQTPPSAAGATSCGWEPAGTPNISTSKLRGLGVAEPEAVVAGDGVARALGLAAPPVAMLDGETAGDGLVDAQAPVTSARASPAASR